MQGPFRLLWIPDVMLSRAMAARLLPRVIGSSVPPRPVAASGDGIS